MRRSLPWAVAALGLALVVVGVTVAWPTAGPGEVTYEATYEPLLPSGSAHRSSLELTVDGTVTWFNAGDLAGAGVALVGALLLAAAGGWALGVRAARAGG